MKSKHVLKIVPDSKSDTAKLGSYYIRPYKSGWSLYHQSYNGKNEKTQKVVPKLSYRELGFRPEMSVDEAKARCKLLNLQNSREKETVREAASRLVQLESLNEVLFPKEYVEGFDQLLENENQGSVNHLKKLRSHFNFVQKMIKALDIFPHEYKQNEKLIYKYLAKPKIKASVNYSQRIISVLNRYGKFVCRKEGRYYDEVSLPRGISLQLIEDAHDGKEGVRTESKPIGPALLYRKRDKLTEKEFNWIFVTVWFGLRPSDEPIEIVENREGLKHLKVYQPKLASVPKPKRYKYIPLLFIAQRRAWEIIDAGDMEPPTYHTLRKVFGKGYGLYAGRKNFVDMMRGHGFDIEDISLWMGHLNIETTWAHYKEKNVLNLPSPKKR